MRVVDSFMFSEAHEKELLLLKLQLEDPVVDRWLITEGAYTFQGEFKGYNTELVLDSDSRFFPFRKKIEVVHVADNYNARYLPPLREYLSRYLRQRLPGFKEESVALSERAAFFAEQNQREAFLSYVLKQHGNDDVLMLTDVDEMLDAVSDRKADLFRKLLGASQLPFKIRRKVFVYDFDNVSTRKRYIPFISIGQVKKLKKKHPFVAQYVKHRMLWDNMPEVVVDIDLLYEFTYCFDKASILRKAKTYAHTGRGESEFERALLCNHVNRTISLIDEAFIRNAENWFSKIEPSTANLPSVVVDKFDQLRTYAVAKNFDEMRRMLYGIE